MCTYKYTNDLFGSKEVEIPLFVYNLHCLLLQGAPGNPGSPGSPGSTGRQGDSGPPVSRVISELIHVMIYVVLIRYCTELLFSV